ncbi:MAG TPA: EscU/YscU/HrcU family type III secretion system export apparatus switch protein [Sandaracinaceae bacterium LLY-WYZ-13_1]|nr:EscU/YscU/HrcU family type III secretion system export apparatus switch protein [Sandaracinaceae bacterium LLY-WYZ-13_1]
MADVDQDQKTEEATPRKKEQLREKGQVAKSPDVAGAATVVAVVATLGATGRGLGADVGRFAERAFRLRDAHHPMRLVEAFGELLFTTVVPVAGVAAVAAIAATMAQTRGLFALASLQPKPERLDPIQGMKKVLPGPQMAVETGKSLLKVGLVSFLVWRIVDTRLPELSTLPAAEPESAAAEVGRIAGALVLQGVAALAVLAAVDYLIAWRRFRKEARMAKHEVKEEHKQTEGDPHLKAKRRAKQREVAQNRSVGDVKQATCLVTNPTHISVALRYDPERGDGAPILLAQGVDEVALRMRVEARKHGVPIVENKPLARALKATGKVGRPIPVELYEKAARVIAHVMQIGGRAGGDA